MLNTPYFTIPLTKKSIPAIGLGTFGSDHVDSEAIAQAVITAVEAGYRHID